jgi:CRISPR/Cas system-associated protein Csm6
MRYYYGGRNILRALDEAEFWKHQEMEHAGLIPVVTPGLEPEFTQRLEQFGIELGRMNAEAVKYIESGARSKGMAGREMKAQMLDFVKRCVAQSQNFSDFMEELLKESHAVQANPPSQTVIHHMIRESQYFIGIDQLMLSV